MTTESAVEPRAIEVGPHSRRGPQLCEVRAGQYWRLDNLGSFDEFLERRFPGSRRKAYQIQEARTERSLVYRCYVDPGITRFKTRALASVSGLGNAKKVSRSYPVLEKRQSGPG